jgi:hypothetical protein
LGLGPNAFVGSCSSLWFFWPFGLPSLSFPAFGPLACFSSPSSFAFGFSSYSPVVFFFAFFGFRLFCFGFFPFFFRSSSLFFFSFFVPPPFPSQVFFARCGLVLVCLVSGVCACVRGPAVPFGWRAASSL